MRNRPRTFVVTGTALLAISSGIALLCWNELSTSEGKKLGDPLSARATRHRALEADAYRMEWRPPSAFAPRRETAHKEQRNDGDDMDERLRAGNRLREKTLMSQEEKEEIQELLSDRDVIKHVTAILLSGRPDELTPEDQQRRMDAVTLLSDALRWKDNPIRKEVLAACKSVILSDNHHQISDRNARESVAADRFELFLALDSIMPVEAAELLKESEGSPNERLIAYSARVAKTVNAHRN